MGLTSEKGACIQLHWLLHEHSYYAYLFTTLSINDAANRRLARNSCWPTSRQTSQTVGVSGWPDGAAIQPWRPTDRRPVGTSGWRLQSDLSPSVHPYINAASAAPIGSRLTWCQSPGPFAPRALPNHRLQREVIAHWPLPVHRCISPASAAAAAAAVITVVAQRRELNRRTLRELTMFWRVFWVG